MSGVRNVSVSVAVLAVMLWGGSVYSFWQDNQNRRAQMAANGKAEKIEARLRATDDEYRPKSINANAAIARKEPVTVLDRADELAAAASKEFSKLTDGLVDMAGLPAVAIANASEKPLGEAEKKSVSFDAALDQIALPQRKLDEPEIALLVEKAEHTDSQQNKKIKASPLSKASEPLKEASKPALELKAAVADLKAIASKERLVAKTKIAEMTAQDLVKAVKETPTLNAPPWTVPFGADPQYDESTAYRVGEPPWRVPTGADPIYPKVSQKIAEIADEVSGSAKDATETAAKKLSGIAVDVKSSIVGDSVWRVPDANDPVYVDQTRLADNDGRWQVPTGVQPLYQGLAERDDDAKDGTRLVHHGRADKLAFVFEDPSKNSRKIAYYDVVPEVEKIEVDEKIEERLSDLPSTEKDDPVEAAKMMTPQEPLIKKDTSRLSKDIVAVPVDKYAGVEAEKLSEVTASIVSKDQQSEITAVEPAKKKVVKKAAPKKRLGLMERVDAELAEIREETAEYEKKRAEKKAAKKHAVEKEGNSPKVAPVKKLAALDQKIAEAVKSSEPIVVAKAPDSLQVKEAIDETEVAEKPEPVKTKSFKTAADEVLSETVKTEKETKPLTKTVALLGRDEERLVNEALKKNEEGLEEPAAKLNAKESDLLTRETEVAALIPEKDEKSSYSLAEKDATTVKDASAAKDTAEIPRKKSIWQVPDGADPQYSVVARLERSLDHVKDVAVEAGDGIASTVSKLHTNVKEAVAAPKRWSVPTGNVWGETDQDSDIEVAAVDLDKSQNKKFVQKIDGKSPAIAKIADEVETDETVSSVQGNEAKDKDSGEITIAAVSDKTAQEMPDVKSKESVIPDLPLLKGAEADALAEMADKTEGKETKVAALTKNPVLSPDREEPETQEPRLFVSAKLQPVGVAPELGGVKPKTESDNSQTGEKPREGVVKKLKGLIALVINDKSKKPAPSDQPDVSRVDEVRFAALKSLMLDQIIYELIDAKKGQGELKIEGRSQPDARLSIYVDRTYLGDVETDDSGNWSLSKSLYLKQGGHLVHAEQMSKSGLSIARKSMEFAQTKALKKPAGYKEDTVGIGLGDKALAVMRDKLSEDDKKAGSPLMAAEADAGERTKPGDVISDLPLPVLKGEDQKAQIRLDDKDAAPVKLASLSKDVARETKSEKLAVKKPAAEIVAETVVDADVRGDDKAVEAVKDESRKPLKQDETLVPEVKAAALETEKDEAPLKDASNKADESDLKTADKKEAVAAVKVNKAQPEEDVENATIKDVPAKVYIVKAGDTLSQIAKRELGDSRKYKDILKLNPKLKNANAIYPKQKLILRGGSEVADLEMPKAEVKVAAVKTDTKVKAEEKPAVKDEKPAELKQVAANLEEETDAAEKPAKEFYVVKAGDNLWKIAQQVYGNGGRYKDIIKLNPELSKNPGMIKPKVKLRVKAA